MRIKQYALLTFLTLIMSDASALYKCTASRGSVSYQFGPCQQHQKQEFISKNRIGKAQIYDGIRFEKGFSLQHFVIEKEPTVSNGEQWVTYEVTATNDTATDREIYLTYQGLDAQGAVLKEVYVVGIVHEHSSRVFRDHATVPVADLNNITQWVLAR